MTVAAIATAPDRQNKADLIRKAVTKGGIEALHDIVPVSFEATLASGRSLADPQILLDEKAVEIMPIVNPLLDAVLISVGCKRIGRRSYTFSLGQNADPLALSALLEAIPVGACVDPGHVISYMGHGFHPYMPCQALMDVLTSPCGRNMSLTADSLDRRVKKAFNGNERFRSGLGVSLRVERGRLHMKIVTTTNSYMSGPPHSLILNPGAAPTNSVDLHRLPAEAVLDPATTAPVDAVTLLEAIVAQGVSVHGDGAFVALRELVRNSATAHRVAGSPGQTRLAIGSRCSLPSSFKQRCSTSGTHQSVVVEAREAGKVLRHVEARGSCAVMDPWVEDTIRMVEAAPAPIDGLRRYQQEAVGLHLATSYGYVNAASPGLGKTVMFLGGCREHSRRKPGWRGLVAVPAAIRTQWRREAETFFPEARARVYSAKEIASGALTSELTEAGDEPMLAIVGYDAARRCADELAAVPWDDLCCDEAAILKSPGSARTQALWRIRENAGRAIALTGTPIERSLDDLGRLVSWVRGDPDLFRGTLRLGKRFRFSNTPNDKGVAERLWHSIGPLVFRRDRSEIADELPVIQTDTILLDPTGAELALAEGARGELKRMYEELCEKVEAARSVDPLDPALAEAQKELISARGAVLGGVTLARMAACDPHSIAESNSAGALLLRDAGLVEPAIRQGATKRDAVSELVCDLVARGEAVLVFTDFSTIADSLATELTQKGVKAATFTGRDTGRRRDAAAQAFQNGDLDVLVLTGAGREGLNLQRASVLIHYDLPWLATQVVQRVGRASRFGSTNKKLSVVIPLLAGTIEERVAAVLVPRAVTALAALDAPRGVKTAETEMGSALRGLADAVSSEHRTGQESIFALASELLG